MNFDEAEIVREALYVLKHGKTMPSYPFMLVGTPDGYEIVPPDQLAALSDEELRGRWTKYDEPNRNGLVSEIWSARGHSRGIDPNRPIWTGNAYPSIWTARFENLILLFWPPRVKGGKLQYVCHIGTEEKAGEGLWWLVNNPDLPTFNGRRCKTAYDDCLIAFDISTFTDNLMDE